MTKAAGRVTVEVESRSETGKNACRRMRARGMIPGTVYGLDRPPFLVAVNPRRIDELLRLVSGVNTVFSLTLVGENRTREAMIKQLQRDPVSEAPLHVDFVRVDVNKPLHVKVPIVLLGTAVGVRLEGGLVDFVHREVEVECLPKDIPEHLEIDVSELHINQHVSFKDLQVPPEVRILGDLEQIIAVIVAPKMEEAPAAEAAAEVAQEPEVIKKGKEGEAEGKATDKEK